jgi:adenine-specific DNA glycosylase
LYLIGVTPHLRKISAIVAELLEWYPQNARVLPWRRTSDPYGVFVSEIMLQQTQVKTVIPYFERWMRQLPTVASLAKASSTKIHKLWEGLGYYRRVRNLQKAAQVIMREHDGSFPQEFESVLALPGIGRYTAGAICSIAFNQPKPILDGNVTRVLARLYGIAGEPREKKTNEQLWKLAETLVSSAHTVSLSSSGGVGLRERRPLARSLMKEMPNLNARMRPPPPDPLLQRRRGRSLTPCSATGGNSLRLLTSAATGNCSRFNQALMELGALICSSRNPRCEVCPLKTYCVAFRENRVEQLPALSRRPRVTARRFMAFVLQHEDRFLVRQRPAKVVNAHLWEFPNVEVGANGIEARAVARRVLGGETESLRPLCVIKHSITRYRITLEAFTCASRSRRGKDAERNRSASLPPPSAVTFGPDNKCPAAPALTQGSPKQRMLRRTGRRLQGEWFTRRRLLQLPFSSAHKKILQRLPAPGRGSMLARKPQHAKDSGLGKKGTGI